MKKRLRCVVGGGDRPERLAFLSRLPAVLDRYRRDRSTTLWLPEDRMDLAVDLKRRCEAAGYRISFAGDCTWELSDLDDDRLVDPRFRMPDFVRMDYHAFVKKVPCGTCTRTRKMLPPDVHPAMLLTGLPDAVFQAASGYATVIEKEFASELSEEGVLTGVKLIDIRTSTDDGEAPLYEYQLLTSTVDLGVPPNADCPECGGELDGTTYFYLFDKPSTDVNVYYSRMFGPTALYMRGHLAKRLILAVEPELYPLRGIGFYPDDAELARVPRLPEDTPEDTP